jgi:methylmalonyl-CoA mutase, C-terminal domain
MWSCVNWNRRRETKGDRKRVFYPGEELEQDGGKKIRVLLAKPGLDGHDRGAKVVAHALREAGMEVVYTGLHQTVPSIVNQAIQEDVDIIGLSIMSGAHIPISRKLMTLLAEEKIEEMIVVVGGVIPAATFRP